MSISTGYTTAEVRELVHEYQLLRHGRKGPWLAEVGLSRETMRRWRAAVFEGDLERGLVPREGSPMTIPPGKRSSLERERAKERAVQAAEVARLTARVRELEETNEALGKAIGLLHALSEHEPDAPWTTSDPSDS